MQPLPTVIPLDEFPLMLTPMSPNSLSEHLKLA
jgi:hypothetical protein